MGSKGANVQAITQEHNVSIKFPERETAQRSTPAPATQPAENGDVGAGVEGEKAGSPGTKSRDVIKITGRLENAEAAKQALLVSSILCKNICFMLP